MQQKEQMKMLEKKKTSLQPVINPNLPALSAIYGPNPKKNSPRLQYYLYYYATNKTGRNHPSKKNMKKSAKLIPATTTM
eukprot:624829-Ditylum_brightwellii.AAC.1